jgi:SAM-dependent methyltransferase
MIIPLRKIAARVLPSLGRSLVRRIANSPPYSAAEYEKRFDLNKLQSIENVLNQNGLAFESFSSILDFGCGRGLLLRHLPWIAPNAKLFGCDIDEQSLAECRQSCRQGQFQVNGARPPLEFQDGQFDLIWSYSVFTNLSEICHAAWLKELGHKLSPGGVMLHTIHSYEYVKRAAKFSPDRLEKYGIEGTVEAFMSAGSGYHFVPYSSDTPDYGATIISEEYVRSNWPEHTGLTIKDYVAGAFESYPEGCQDMVLLAKGPRR